jgi:hypothetical protein
MDLRQIELAVHRHCLNDGAAYLYSCRHYQYESAVNHGVITQDQSDFARSKLESLWFYAGT